MDNGSSERVGEQNEGRGAALQRSSTRETHQSGGSGGSGDGAAGAAAAGFSKVKSLFTKKRGSISQGSGAGVASPEAGLSPTSPSSSSFSASQQAQQGSVATDAGTSGSALAQVRDSDTQAVPTNLNTTSRTVPVAITTGVPFNFGPAPTVDPSASSTAPSNKAPAYTATSSSDSRASITSSATSQATMSTAPTSIAGSPGVGGSAPSTTAAASPAAPFSNFASIPAATAGPSNGPSRPTVQQRMKTLPRLASYTVARPSSSGGPAGGTAGGGGNGNDLARVTSSGSEYDTTTSLSGTDTEHDLSDTETDDDEDDDDDREHDERDVPRGGASAMRSSLSRPALPTLTSRSGGLNRLGSSTGGSPFGAGRNTPGGINSSSTSPNPFQFQGWTTFASSTPTPGPSGMRTARPGPGDNVADGSYFDARPRSSATPAQTPKALAETPGRMKAVVQPMPTSTPGSASSSPASRIRVDPRPQGSGTSSPLKTSTNGISQVPVVTSSGQVIPASAIPGLPGAAYAGSSGNANSPLVGSNRPSFYHRQSKSLVDLSRSLQEHEPTPAVSSPRSRPTSSSGSGVQTPQRLGSVAEQPSAAVTSVHEESGGTPVRAPAAVPDPDDEIALASPELGDRGRSGGRSMGRRQSMPEMRIDPPSYQIDDDFVVPYVQNKPPVAREDEGREALPDYTCDVHIEAYVPRKMEFLKPGVQAKDRRWKRQYVILHGTSIKVYKADPRQKAVPGEELQPAPLSLTSKDPRRMSVSSGHSGNSATGRAPAQLNTAAGQLAARHRAQTVSSVSSAESADSEKSMQWAQNGNSTANRRKFDPDVPVHVHVQEDTEHGLASLQHAPAALLAKAGENRVLRHYTLQDAESGLAADYLKRRHVVRIRAEGEQFLIQAKDDKAVIDWIEALQAATNTALDLDVRPLPKFITLPRRRRRRPRPDGTAAAGAAAPGTAAGADANAARSANNGSPAAGTTARSDAMNNMLAEEQNDYMRASGGGVIS